ncbi:MAG: EamA family transporter [Melioribacteraceae bacterium]|nr:EamA family transporter [Melioribacteraceae bacterium]
MISENLPRSKAIPVLQALLVTLLWSSSFVIIKIGLEEIPPIVFAGLRYSIAAICLLPFLFKKENLIQVSNLNSVEIIKLGFYGVLFIALTQGAMFLGLSFLPSVTVSLILNFTPIVVAGMGIILINEIPTQQQWIGTLLFMIGVITYFYPIDFTGSEVTGIIVMLMAVIFNAGSSVLGRDINRARKCSPLIITTISMLVGSIILLSTGIYLQGFPSISLFNFLLLLWMAVINTAFAFTLWNKTLRSLTAMESSIINGTMLIQIGVLAWIFLGEEITSTEIAGMLIAAAGALLVQLKSRVIK